MSNNEAQPISVGGREVPPWLRWGVVFCLVAAASGLAACGGGTGGKTDVTATPFDTNKCFDEGCWMSEAVRTEVTEGIDAASTPASEIIDAGEKVWQGAEDLAATAVSPITTMEPTAPAGAR